jgi:hypothetical protein
MQIVVTRTGMHIKPPIGGFFALNDINYCDQMMPSSDLLHHRHFPLANPTHFIDN